MISQEMKNQIEKEARVLKAADLGCLPSEIESNEIVDYTTGATKYAEKLEEKDKIIESKDKEIKELEKQLILNEEAEIQFIKQLKSKDREIEQLTQDIKDQGEYLKEMINVNALNDAFNSGEEWRKNHKVKEGEQFTDYFLRVFNVEKEDRDRELAQLKEIVEKRDAEIKRLEARIRDLRAWSIEP